MNGGLSWEIIIHNFIQPFCVSGRSPHRFESIYEENGAPVRQRRNKKYETQSLVLHEWKNYNHREKNEPPSTQTNGFHLFSHEWRETNFSRGRALPVATVAKMWGVWSVAYQPGGVVSREARQSS